MGQIIERLQPMSVPRARSLLILAGLLSLVAGLGLLLIPSIDSTIAGMLVGAGTGFLFVAVLTVLVPPASEVASAKVHQRYLRNFFPAMAAYIVVLPVSIWLLMHADMGMGVRTVVALLPVFPMALVLRAFVGYVRGVDEMQQRIELEAISIATAVVSLGCMALGFLQSAKVINIAAAAAMLWVFPMICLVYGIAKAIGYRRYQ